MKRSLTATTTSYQKKSTALIAIILSGALTFSVPIAPCAYASEERGAADTSSATDVSSPADMSSAADAPSTADMSSTAEGSEELGTVDNPALLPADQVVQTSLSLEEVQALFADSSQEANTESGQAYQASSLSANSALATYSTSENDQVVELYGDRQYNTAAAEALYSFSSSEYAIIASGISGVDALSATALAGALECPILLASDDYLPSVTADALEELGVTQPILVGGTSALSEEVEQAVANVTGASIVRLWGNGIIDTQLDIFYYGQEKGLWSDMCLVAQGVKSYADALSFSPVAYKMKAPVFLVDEDGLLPEKSQTALKEGKFTRAYVGGLEGAVAEETIPVVRGLLYGSASVLKDSVVRLGGDLLYDTSATIAQWAVDQGILSYDKAAFATGTTMTDSLAGAAVQARDNSVILLIDPGYYSTLDAITPYKDEVNSIKFFGGPMVVSLATRNKVTDTLGLERSPLNDTYVDTSELYNYEYISLSLQEFAEMEVGYKVNSDGSSCSASDILEYMDPNKYDNSTSEYMEFVDIGAGYSGISAETIDNFIATYCKYSEEAYGVTSNLRGMGETIVEAAKTYNLNEAYLTAHAVIESAWGCSYLSQGLLWDSDAEEWYDCGYLNFFGIGAFDSDPENGASVGKYYGWSSPESAIKGGAAWISRYYVHSGDEESGDQNTLWKMAWDATAAANYGMSYTHQYATGRTWATSIAVTMDSLYTRHMGRYFDFDELGISVILPVFED